MDITTIATILAIVTVAFIAFWFFWLLGLMNRQVSGARKPMDEANRSYAEGGGHKREGRREHRDK